MKKLILALFISSYINILGTIIERDGIVLEYTQISFIPWSINGSQAHRLEIINNSDHAIFIDPTIISRPLLSYQKVSTQIEEKYKRGIGISLLPAIASVFIGNSTDSFYKTIRSFGLATSLVLVGYQLYFLYTFDSFKQKILCDPVKIEPKSQVKKLFWLADSKATFEINVETIKSAQK
jgi:hypothetical protein